MSSSSIVFGRALDINGGVFNNNKNNNKKNDASYKRSNKNNETLNNDNNRNNATPNNSSNKEFSKNQSNASNEDAGFGRFQTTVFSVLPRFVGKSESVRLFSYYVGRAVAKSMEGMLST